VQGAQGQTGAQGAQGQAGAQGSQGQVGAQGAVGVQGSQGSQGVGVQGSQGQTGVQGAQGDIGAQGSQGQVGAQGAPGSGGGGGGSYRVVASTSESDTININASTTDLATYVNTTFSSGSSLTINAPTGSIVEGQKIMIRLKCTNYLNITYDPVYTGSTDVGLPSVTSSGAKFDYLGFIYNGTSWNLLAKNFGF
jgi:hypothetical protein